MAGARAIHQLSRVVAWASQGLNVLLLGGHPNETVSGRAYRMRRRRVWRAAYQALNAIYFWQEDHCQASHLADLRWAQEMVDAH